MIDNLYQELIIDHSQRPRHFGRLETATHSKRGYNPLCGDDIEIFLVLDGDVIKEIKFTGKGCAISTASASLLLDTMRGKTVEAFQAMFKSFHAMMMSQAHDDLGKLAALEGVREYPMRIKCATLAWHTLKAIIDNTEENVSTE